MAEAKAGEAQKDKKADLDKEAEGETSKGKVNRMVAIGIVVLVAVIGSGVFFAFKFVEGERQRALNEWQIRLGIVADSRVADINDWFDGNFDVIAELTENASLQIYLTELSDSKGASAALSSEVAVLSMRRAMNGFVGPADILGALPAEL